MRWGAELFNRYGAKFTAESALPFARGCENFGDNVLEALLDSTMGVGSHSNTTNLYYDTQLVIDRLVGKENNRGISGGWNPLERLDWAQEAINLGYKYIDAPVYFCYLMVPQHLRPDQVSDQEIIDSLYHDPVPPDFEERIHPHRISSATTFSIDTTGDILFLTGSIGELGSLAEGRKNCFPTCVFDEADIDTLIAKVRHALELADSDDFTVLYCHTPLKYYKTINKDLFEKLFYDLSGLVDSGRVEYATQGQIYDHFLSWEQTTDVPNNQKYKKIFYKLFQNYPNQFNSKTLIKYQLSETAHIELTIFNQLGQKIKTLVSEFKLSGNHSETWDGKDDLGNSVCSGIYYYQLKTNNGFRQMKKLLFLK